MARARNIKPGFFKNYLLADLGPHCQILFAGLWCLADREGRLEDKSRLIKAELFPYYDFDVNGGLTELERCNFIKRYNRNGNAFIQVVNFKKHQSPHGTEKASSIPAHDGTETQNHCSATAPEVHGGLTVCSPSNNDGNRPDSLIPDSLIAEGDARPTPSSDGQDYIDRITKHDRANQSVTMTTDWRPGEQFPALMMRAGVPMAQFTDDLLAKFVIHHHGTSKPNNKWEAALVTWCKTEYASPPKTAQSGQFGRYVEQPMDYPLAEPDKDMYAGPVDPKSAASALAAMREKIRQDGEAF